MKENIMVFIPSIICLIAVAFILFLLIKHREQNEVTATKRVKIFLPILLIVCVSCLFAQGFIISQILNVYFETRTSTIQPLSTNLIQFQKENVYPKVIDKVDISLNTTEKGLFKLKENILFVPGNKTNIYINLSETKIEDFSIDFTNNTTFFSLNNREYVVVNKEVFSNPQKIEPSIWTDATKNINKLYTAVPLSESEELMFYTEISDIAENKTAIEEVSSVLNKFIEGIIITNNFVIDVNGVEVNAENIAYITPTAITLNDNSFLTSTPYTDSQYKNLINLYTEEVFKSWQTSTKISEDSENRKAYVIIQDNIRYTLFTKEENLESSKSVFTFIELSSKAGKTNEKQ